MSGRFITYVIIGVAFGFTQLWFAYWVVKLYKEKQRILKARKAGRRAAHPGQASPTAGGPAVGQKPPISPSPDNPPQTG
ncbi:MAG: hypothetical protein NTU62_11580 [Spirochaetes bacterium]|nr:hypothetical protein [Spirochaetota bacterium]